jgi:hypothetical protein
LIAALGRGPHVGRWSRPSIGHRTRRASVTRGAGLPTAVSYLVVAGATVSGQPQSEGSAADGVLGGEVASLGAGEVAGDG